MRQLLILLVILTGLGNLTGCRTVDPQAKREISLLRAEILDLEDQFYALKSRHRSTLTDLATCRGEPVPEAWDDPIGNAYYETGGAIVTGDHCADCGAVIYDSGTVQHGNTIGTGIVDQGVVDPIGKPFEESNPRAQPVSPLPIEPTPRTPEVIEGLEEKGSTHHMPRRIPDLSPDRGSRNDNWRPRHNTTGHDGLMIEMEGNPIAGDEWKKSESRDALHDHSRSTYLEVSNAGQPATSQVRATGSPARVEQIFIDPEMTWGTELDSEPGHDGLSLLIQPLDVNGEVIPVASDLVVSVIDSKEIGEAQRIGLWKFQAYQVEPLLSHERGQRGIQLELPWQRRVPQNKALLVFVRYVTSDGRKLETSLEVFITPPDTGALANPEDLMTGRSESGIGPISREPISSTARELPTWKPVR